MLWHSLKLAATIITVQTRRAPSQLPTLRTGSAPCIASETVDNAAGPQSGDASLGQKALLPLLLIGAVSSSLHDIVHVGMMRAIVGHTVQDAECRSFS